MKIIRFEMSGKVCIGALADDQIVDGSAIGLSGDMLEFLARGEAGIKILTELIDSGEHRFALADVCLLAPIAKPAKFLGISLNYGGHIKETGMERPDYPSFFNKQNTCVIGPGEAIHRPHVSEKLDYEGELAVVIGKSCRHVPREHAYEVIAGYTIVNDVSVRDWQIRSPTFTIGKSFDTHGPMGPCIVTPDEITDPHNLRVQTWVSDEVRQDFNTSDQLFRIDEQIEALSTAFTLEPGDVIATGTGSGVGVKMKPRGYMKPGDTVRIEIEGIGSLENPVVMEPDETAHW